MYARTCMQADIYASSSRLYDTFGKGLRLTALPVPSCRSSSDLQRIRHHQHPAAKHVCIWQMRTSPLGLAAYWLHGHLVSMGADCIQCSSAQQVHAAIKVWHAGCCVLHAQCPGQPMHRRVDSSACSRCNLTSLRSRPSATLQPSDRWSGKISVRMAGTVSRLMGVCMAAEDVQLASMVAICPALTCLLLAASQQPALHTRKLQLDPASAGNSAAILSGIPCAGSSGQALSLCKSSAAGCTLSACAPARPAGAHACK